MAEPTHEASQPLTEIGVDFTQLLPPELLSQIMTYRAAHRVDLKSMALTCKNLYAAAFALLFETATIAVSLTDEIASVGQAWRPLRWETPAFLTHLLHSAHLRVQIRNVRIIVQPWPTGIWTNERFASQKARLKEKRDEAINVLGRIPQQHMHQPNLDANPRGQDSRQLFIIDAYYSLFHSHCADRDGRHRADWTEDSDLLLQPLLRQLPSTLR